MRTIFSVEAKKKRFDCYITLVEYVYVLYGLLRHGLFPLVMCGLCYLWTIIKYKQHNQELLIDQLEETSRWSNNYLPQEIMESILMRLCRIDYLSVHAVCSSWRAAVARIISEERCPPTDHHRVLPALLLFSSYQPLNPISMDHTLLKLQFNNINPMGLLSDGSRVSKSCHADLSRQYCCGSIGGWLIITDGFMWRPEAFLSSVSWSLPSSSSFSGIMFEKVKNFFYNPVSRAKVTLPSQLSLLCYGSDCIMFFRMVVASSVPNSPHCIVAALSEVGDLAFCRPSDKKWTLLYNNKMGEFNYISIAIHDGKLYAMTHQAHIFVMVFDLLSDDAKGKELKIVSPRPKVRNNFTLRDHVYTIPSTSALHLVSDFDRGELLLIVQTTNCAYRDDSFVNSMFFDFIRPPIAELFQVFRLDESGPDPQWVELETLGDRILFITNRSCMCASASAIGDNCDQKGLIEGNLIYFAFDYNCRASPSLGRDVGVFSLTDESIRRNLHQTIPRSWASHSPIWFTPNLW